MQKLTKKINSRQRWILTYKDRIDLYKIKYTGAVKNLHVRRCSIKIKKWEKEIKELQRKKDSIVSAHSLLTKANSYFGKKLVFHTKEKSLNHQHSNIFFIKYVLESGYSGQEMYEKLKLQRSTLSVIRKRYNPEVMSEEYARFKKFMDHK